MFRVILLIFLGISQISHALESNLVVERAEPKIEILNIDLIGCKTTNNLINELQNNHIVIARSGCCSHHQGVCGCSFGRQVCCDGTLSPTCRC